MTSDHDLRVAAELLDHTATLSSTTAPDVPSIRRRRIRRGRIIEPNAGAGRFFVGHSFQRQRLGAPPPVGIEAPARSAPVALPERARHPRSGASFSFTYLHNGRFPDRLALIRSCSATLARCFVGEHARSVNGRPVRTSLAIMAVAL